jgi:hypothetical protein
MAGYPVNRQVLDNRVGALVVQVREVLEDVQRIHAFLAAELDADLVTMGYTQGEVDLLKSSFTDLDKLARIANGSAVQADASNFFFWAKNLTGLS